MTTEAVPHVRPQVMAMMLASRYELPHTEEKKNGTRTMKFTDPGGKRWAIKFRR